MNYQPPYTISPEILHRVVTISVAVWRMTVRSDLAKALRLQTSVAPAHPCACDRQVINVHQYPHHPRFVGHRGQHPERGEDYRDFGGQAGDRHTLRGWAVIENDELNGRIYLHQADDSAFRATKTE